MRRNHFKAFNNGNNALRVDEIYVREFFGRDI